MHTDSNAAASIDTQLADCRRTAILEARRRGLPLTDAEDIAQDVTLRLWTLLTRDKTIKSVDAWTRRATYNLIIDQHRRRTSDKSGGKITETLVNVDESRFLRA